MTALTVNGSAAAATTLAAAGKLFNATGGTSGNTSTKIAKTTQFVQVFAEGTTTAQTGVASIPAPTDSNFNGWMLDDTTLEGQRIAASTWTPTFHMLSSVASTSVTPTVEWFKRSSSGVYTSIGSVTGSSVALGTTSTALTFTPPSLALVDFAAGDKLVMWLWVNVAAAGSSTTRTVSVVEATSGSTAGVASEAQTVTPGYAPAPVALVAECDGVGRLPATLSIPGGTLTLYGSSTADTTLTTACDMSTALSGIETSKKTTVTGAGTYTEVLPQGGATTGVTAIPATPTGNGWVFQPGAGTFAAGNWSAAFAMAWPFTGTLAGDLTLRFFTYSGGIFTSIGQIVVTSPPGGLTRAVITFAATSMGTVTTGATDFIYIDLWVHDTSGISGDNPIVFESISLIAGVANDVQVTTSGFTAASSGVSLSGEGDGVGTLSGAFSLATALLIESDGVSVLAGALAAALTLSPSTIAGTSTITGSIQLATALVDSLAGRGTLVGSLAAALTLGGTSSIGIGTIAASLSATTPLASTLAGIGTITASVQLTSVLTGTIAEIGVCTAAFSLATSLGATFTGRGILTGVLGTTAPVALAVTMTGIGTLTGTTQFSTTLASPIAGVGILASSWALATSLAGSATSVGILSGTLTASLALPGRTLAGIGTLSGTLGVGGQAALNVSIPGVGTLTGSLAATSTLAGVTLPGVGTLSGVGIYSVTLAYTSVGVGTLVGALVARLSLASVSLTGVGTLSGTMTLAGQAALSISIPGRGILSGTLAAQTTLGGTSLVGIGTLAGTIQRQIMLTCTLAESGQLSPGLGAHTVLPSTSVGGLGTAAFTLFAQTSFVVQMTSAGMFTITGVSYQAQMALLLSGIASLSGRLSIPILSYLNATCITRDMQVTAKTRDMQAVALIRDMQVTAKTRR